MFMQEISDDVAIMPVSRSVPRSIDVVTREAKPVTALARRAPMSFTEGLAGVGLDWTVSKETVHHSDGSLVPDCYSVRRNDNKRSIGTVGNRYKPVQNFELARDLDELFAGELSGVLSFERGGSFGGGARVYMQARMPDALALRLFRGEDTSLPYLCFTDSKDGSTGLRMFPTSVRIVCRNTYAMAIRQAKNNANAVNLRHSGDLGEKRKAAIAAIRGMAQGVKEFHDAMHVLADKKLRAERIAELVASEILPPEEGKEHTKPAKRKIETIMELIENGNGSEIYGVRGTAYGVFQAVTEFSNHYSPVRGSLAEASEVRFERVLEGDALSDRALKVLLAA